MTSSTSSPGAAPPSVDSALPKQIPQTASILIIINSIATAIMAVAIDSAPGSSDPAGCLTLPNGVAAAEAS